MLVAPPDDFLLLKKGLDRHTADLTVTLDVSSDIELSVDEEAPDLRIEGDDEKAPSPRRSIEVEPIFSDDSEQFWRYFCESSNLNYVLHGSYDSIIGRADAKALLSNFRCCDEIAERDPAIDLISGLSVRQLRTWLSSISMLTADGTQVIKTLTVGAAKGRTRTRLLVLQKERIEEHIRAHTTQLLLPSTSQSDSEADDEHEDSGRGGLRITVDSASDMTKISKTMPHSMAHPTLGCGARHSEIVVVGESEDLELDGFSGEQTSLLPDAEDHYDDGQRPHSTREDMRTRISLHVDRFTFAESDTDIDSEFEFDDDADESSDESEALTFTTSHGKTSRDMIGVEHKRGEKGEKMRAGKKQSAPKKATMASGGGKRHSGSRTSAHLTVPGVGGGASRQQHVAAESMSHLRSLTHSIDLWTAEEEDYDLGLDDYETDDEQHTRTSTESTREDCTSARSPSSAEVEYWSRNGTAHSVSSISLSDRLAMMMHAPI
jgi:hypothetical protein